MANRFASVKYKHDVKCLCGKILAQRGQMSAAVDANGDTLDIPSIGSDGGDSFYELTCPECGHSISMESPRDVLDYSVFDLVDCTAPPIRYKW